MKEPNQEQDNRETGFSALPKQLQIMILILVVSVVALGALYVYASNWESIAAKDYPGQIKNKFTTWKEDYIRKHEDPEEHIWFVYDMAVMSHEMPVLMRDPEGVSLISVPLISQEDCHYRTGCELVSGAMVLQYYGISASPADLYEAIDKEYSPTGQGVGVSPADYFIGNPATYGGYGCYAPALAKAMNAKADGAYYAIDVSGTELTDLETNYVKKGTPVIIWATIHMEEPKAGNSWQLEDGSTFQWLAGEHCLVLVGSDEHYYYFNDPNHAGEIVGYERSVVTERFHTFGKQAIVLSR